MPAHSSEQQIEITSCAKLVFSQFWRCFCETQNSKEHIAGIIIYLKSVMRWKSQLEGFTFFKFSGNNVIDDFAYFLYFKALIHSRHFKFSGMGVIRGLTRPLPVPGPLGVPGPYQVFPGTRLKTIYPCAKFPGWSKSRFTASASWHTQYLETGGFFQHPLPGVEEVFYSDFSRSRCQGNFLPGSQHDVLKDRKGRSGSRRASSRS